MSKLDKECIDEADSFINAIGDRELNLRDLRLQRIENLILTKDQNQTIDFTDNDILKLAYFPKMSNLETILLGNNRVAKIEENIGDFLPNLKHLILTNNAIQELGDLDPLGTLESLESLSLLENPVVTKEYYRSYVLHRCAKLRFLDFKKVKEKV
jgi:U2 small nuclear ribonucleoprotein A'